MTSKEFAQMLGVAQSTVSRALNDSPEISEVKKAFIRQKAFEYGFELNSQAQSLKTNKTGTIGILFPRHFKSMNENLMMARLYDFIQREMNKNDYDVMTIHDAAQEGNSALERIIKRRKVDGLITLRIELSEREKRLIQDSNFPCVSMLTVSELAEELYYCLSDSEHGGYLAGDFLGRFDEFEPMYLAIEEETEDSARRRSGFERGLSEHGRVLRPDQVVYCKLSFNSAFDTVVAMRERLASTKTAILAYSDMVGMGAVGALRESGIDIPGQVQVIGMDDLPMASWIRPRLSTLHVPVEEMVPKGCRLLCNLIEGKPSAEYKIIYNPTLVLRETTQKR